MSGTIRKTMLACIAVTAVVLVVQWLERSAVAQGSLEKSGSSALNQQRSVAIYDYKNNSTDPVTVWYVDHNGYMVRIQPLE